MFHVNTFHRNGCHVTYSVAVGHLIFRECFASTVRDGVLGRVWQMCIFDAVSIPLYSTVENRYRKQRSDGVFLEFSFTLSASLKILAIQG